MKRRICAAATCRATLVLAAWTSLGEAADPPSRPTERPRPYGMVDVGLGVLTLPGAEVCVEREARCAQGDTSLMITAWQLFGFDRFVVGGGATLGLTPTTDAPRSDPAGLPRDHSRRYFTVEVAGRYLLLREEFVELWGGLTSGLVVVSDSFLTQRGLDDRALIGPRGVTIRTEGFVVNAAFGGGYQFAPSFWAGAAVRYGQWFLPGVPEQNPLGDEASLKGRTSVFDVSLAVSYRLPL